MSDTFDIDPQLLQEFLHESLDTLDGLDPLFVALEKKPEDVAIVDRIFRPVHSIKGNSSFFGLTNIKNFSHAMENLLQEIRSHKRQATKPIIDALLQGVDFLREMLERLASGERAVAFLPAEEKHLALLTEISKSEEASIADLARHVRKSLDVVLELDIPDALQPVLVEHKKILSDLLHLVAPITAEVENVEFFYFLDDETDVTEPMTTIVGFVTKIKAQQKDEIQVEAFLAALGTMLNITAQKERPELHSALDALEDEFKTINGAGLEFDDLLASLARERLDTITNHLNMVEKEAVATPQPDQKAPATEKPEEPEETKPESSAKHTPAESGGKTLRVAEETVDHFMNYVGELIIASEVFNYLQKKLEARPGVKDVAQEFKNQNLSFNELSTNLQKSLMAVRRIPLRQVFQKLPRTVRDLSDQLEKDVQINIVGEDIQIDKSLLEGLENPLVHMVRNSVDHGIESPEEREAAGKPRTGTVDLIASATEETFTLVLRDDGKGLDVDAIKEKAVKNGVITSERARAMDDKEAYRLIFGAGVSTAKIITDVSGRGVGMDVVMSNISALNGNVDIESEIGIGSTFTITLPMTVTLMVVDGLVARIGEQSYIIPLTDVRESVRPTAEQIHTVSGKGEMLEVRGELCRLVRMYRLLASTNAIKNPADATIVLVESNGKTLGLMVDELLGQQSVVLKDLGDQFTALHILQGAAILGDGRVGLVFDTEGLIEEFES